MTRPAVVVGDLVTDVLAVLAEPLAPGSDATARVRLAGGGQAANTAAWLARCGVPVALAATVGGDLAGRDRVAELAAAGVDTAAVRRVEGASTGTLVVLTGSQDRTMLTDRGAADQLRPADVDASLALRTGPSHVHVSGYALLGEGSRAAGQHALATARERGLTTSVDAASTAPLRQLGAATFLGWVRGVDLLFVNAGEAAVLGLPGPGPAGAVVVKRGAGGAAWYGPTTVEVAAPSVPVIDSTGAGDAFAAGLLSAWLAGADPATALRAGTALGAEAVGLLGARPPATP